ncbi:UNVERIFIED_CONTAM: hypothetical protein Scaly_3045200 [Sesamum calycinum]|uniref:Uncharacterized protein n=1 Tax=Sesamum calycinum TaxID=2727403 RepID=A0AAW2K1H4_9LAMI
MHVYPKGAEERRVVKDSHPYQAFSQRVRKQSSDKAGSKCHSMVVQEASSSGVSTPVQKRRFKLTGEGNTLHRSPKSVLCSIPPVGRISFCRLSFPSLSKVGSSQTLACYKLGSGTAVSRFPCSRQLVLDRSDRVFIIWSKRIRTFCMPVPKTDALPLGYTP